MLLIKSIECIILVYATKFAEFRVGPVASYANVAIAQKVSFILSC